jgi:hypothetical protein
VSEGQIGLDLSPLEAKALHVMGLLMQNFEAAGHLLYFGGQKMGANYYLQAFLLACTDIELLAYCKNGREKLCKDYGKALKSGFELVSLAPVVETNHNKYTVDDLVSLRNLAAHGQGVVCTDGEAQEVEKTFLDIELLDSFPGKLMVAFDRYYDDLFQSGKRRWRTNLANAGIRPVHYSNAGRSGHAFWSPILYAYENLIVKDRPPSKALVTTDWQVYK